MTLRFLTINIRQLLDVRPGEAARIGFMAAFLFFLLAANNVIKIVRDALFLSRFPITQLPYVYLLAAVVAGVVISIYSRYTFRLSLVAGHPWLTRLHYLKRNHFLAADRFLRFRLGSLRLLHLVGHCGACCCGAILDVGQ